MTNIEKLRDLIKEGFREYDGDIMEEAIELLDIIENNNKIIVEQFNAQSDDLKRLTKQANSTQTITHGTGGISYFIHPESAVVWQELMDAIKHASATTALPVIINAINSTGSRF